MSHKQRDLEPGTEYEVDLYLIPSSSSSSSGELVSEREMLFETRPEPKGIRFL